MQSDGEEGAVQSDEEEGAVQSEEEEGAVQSDEEEGAVQSDEEEGAVQSDEEEGVLQSKGSAKGNEKGTRLRFSGPVFFFLFLPSSSLFLVFSPFLSFTVPSFSSFLPLHHLTLPLH